MSQQELVITLDGDRILFLDSAAGRELASALDGSVCKRASHVEPDGRILRYLFHALRCTFGEAGIVAAFTRLWPCLWRVQIIDGPVLEGRWRNRQQAIDAEIEFLNDWYLNR